MEDLEKEASRIIKGTYAQQGFQNIRARYNLLRNLMIHGKIPDDKFSDDVIEGIVKDLSAMDSNNFQGNVGVGEREGRVYSSVVARRHFYLSHGIGRSGDIAEQQPKAAGSSLIYKLTNKMMAHAFKIAGFKSLKECLVLPMATGMCCTMCLLTLKRDNPTGKYVIFPRIDQKSCFKAILTAGLMPIIVENLIADGVMSTNISQIDSLLSTHGAEVLCVLSTTSCFAPRQADKVDEIAALCKAKDVPHVINNAYGIQSNHIAKLVTRAITIGRVDAVIQSTDKNFMVPVGGSVVACPVEKEGFLRELSNMYPGRASITPILDVFITFLSMGVSGYKELLADRYDNRTLLLQGLGEFCTKHGGYLIKSPGNDISTALSLPILQENPKFRSFFGAMLFQRNISGCRVVSVNRPGEVTKLSGHSFANWGSHSSEWPATYVTVACALGMKRSDIRVFLDKLDKTYIKFIKLRSTALEKEENIKKASADSSFASPICSPETALTSTNDAGNAGNDAGNAGNAGNTTTTSSSSSSASSSSSEIGGGGGGGGGAASVLNTSRNKK